MGEDVHCVIVWAVPHRVPTQPGVVNKIHTRNEGPCKTDYIIIFLGARRRRIHPCHPQRQNKSLFGGSHEGERDGGRGQETNVWTEREILCTNTVHCQSLSLSLFLSSVSSVDGFVASLSQPRFLTHPIPSDLSSLIPPLHITSARFRPHMLTACYPY
jgi:hypothetical protein